MVGPTFGHCTVAGWPVEGYGIAYGARCLNAVNLVILPNSWYGYQKEAAANRSGAASRRPG